MFQIALSVPGCVSYIFGDEDHQHDPQDLIRSMDTDDWLQQMLSKRSWSGWYCYNDDPPDQRIEYTSDGHCKGIVMWDETFVAWLVHTVCQWPIKMPIECIPLSAHDEGHSFAYWMGSRALLPKVEQQVDLMGARVYAGRRSQITRRLHIGTLQRIKLDDQTDHIAKNKMWGRDVYQSLGKCSVQSRASLDDTSLVHNVSRIDLPGWNAAVDFGRWAVGDTWIAVGDIRRGKRDFAVGGGALIRYDATLARRLGKIISPQ